MNGHSSEFHPYSKAPEEEPIRLPEIDNLIDEQFYPIILQERVGAGLERNRPLTVEAVAFLTNSEDAEVDEVKLSMEAYQLDSKISNDNIKYELAHTSYKKLDLATDEESKWTNFVRQVNTALEDEDNFSDDILLSTQDDPRDIDVQLFEQTRYMFEKGRRFVRTVEAGYLINDETRVVVFESPSFSAQSTREELEGSGINDGAFTEKQKQAKNNQKLLKLAKFESRFLRQDDYDKLGQITVGIKQELNSRLRDK